MAVPIDNSIMVIRPYKEGSAWVFDDPFVGLFREAFVAGADRMIDFAVSKFGIDDPGNGFTMIFSHKPFPDFQIHLEWDRVDDYGIGNFYKWNEAGIEGWLCPALFKYFPQAPKDIYVSIRK